MQRSAPPAHDATYRVRATFPRVARTPKVPRNFRVAPHAWADALATAAAAGHDLADELRGFVDWYSRQPGARAPRRPDKAVRAPRDAE